MTRFRLRATAILLATLCVTGTHAAYAQAAKRPPARSRTLAWSSPVGAEQLSGALASLIDRAVKSGQWGVLVVSLTQGDTLFKLNADTALAPASTMKVFTSAAALDYLGPTYQFETQALREGEVDSLGVLHGDIVLRGAGDPLLGAHDGENPLRTLARSVAEAGVKQVTGTVVGDGSAFESQRVPDGWLQRNLSTKYARRVSALSFNQNVVSVTVRVVNGKARAELYPSISGLPISNGVTVRANSKGGSVSIRQNAATGTFYVSGWIGANSPARGNSVNIENPELFAAAAFREALTAEGIKVTGTRVVAHTSTDSAARIAGIPSEPLADLIAQMNGESNNHFAELLFRNVARTTGTIGSADSGNAIMHSFLSEKVGTPASEFFMADGSGLSTLDRVTPRNLVSVLDYSSKAAWSTVFASSLPVAGESETLRSRMRGAPAQGKLRAKTGTTGLVISLGGYVTAADGEELAFAFIYNGSERTRARQAIDAMGSTLASFSR